MVGRLTLGQIEQQLADPANGLLSEASQASFDEAHRQLNEELAAKLKPAIDKMLPEVVSPVLSDTMRKLQDAAPASIKLPTFEMPAVENLRRLESQQSQHRVDIQARLPGEGLVPRRTRSAGLVDDFHRTTPSAGPALGH